MRRNVMDTLREYRMVEPGDRVLAGLSGGADSVAMLHCLAGLREELDFSLTACHVNHCIRGEEAGRDQRFCEELCGRLEIPLTVMTEDVPVFAQEKGLGLEEAARELRYACFFRAAGQLAGSGGAVKAATAHTLSDSLETVLFSLARGTGLAGLCGIPPVRHTVGRPDVIRPLIRVTRRETEEYCRANGLEYVTDSTNLDERYTRNRIRRQLVPLLRELNPNLEQTVGRMTETLREDQDCLEGLAEEFLRLHGLPGEGGVLESIPRGPLLELPPAAAVRVLRRMMLRHGLPYDQKRLSLCRGAAREGRGAVELQKDIFLWASPARIWLERREEPVPYFEFPFGVGNRVETQGKNYTAFLLDCEQTEKFKKFGPNGLKNCLDYDKIYGIVKLRQKRDGDRYTPWRRSGSHSLKKLFQEAGVSPRERGRLAVLEDSQGILWVEGIGCAQRAAPGPSSERLLEIEVTRASDPARHDGGSV